jgi:hypothetical protein
VGAADFIAALVVIWSFSQLVRSWGRLRLVAGVLFGVLLIYVAAGLEYRLADLPALRKNWHEHKAQILRRQNIEPDSFAAEQYERKVLAGDVGQSLLLAHRRGTILADEIPPRRRQRMPFHRCRFGKIKGLPRRNAFEHIDQHHVGEFFFSNAHGRRGAHIARTYYGNLFSHEKILDVVLGCCLRCKAQSFKFKLPLLTSP